jgi:hypothetical protein
MFYDFKIVYIHGRVASSTSPIARPSMSTSTDAKKRHVCVHCDQVCSTSSHLARHARIHSGVKEFKCDYPGCEKRSSRLDNLRAQFVFPHFDSGLVLFFSAPASESTLANLAPKNPQNPRAAAHTHPQCRPRLRSRPPTSPTDRRHQNCSTPQPLILPTRRCQTVCSFSCRPLRLPRGDSPKINSATFPSNLRWPIRGASIPTPDFPGACRLRSCAMNRPTGSTPPCMRSAAPAAGSITLTRPRPTLRRRRVPHTLPRPTLRQWRVPHTHTLHTLRILVLLSIPRPRNSGITGVSPKTICRALCRVGVRCCFVHLHTYLDIAIVCNTTISPPSPNSTPRRHRSGPPRAPTRTARSPGPGLFSLQIVWRTNRS